MRVLTLGDATFPLSEDLPKGGRFLVLTKRMQSKSADERLAALYDFITMWLDGRTGTTSEGVDVDFDDALSELEIDEIQASLAEAVKGAAKRPTTRSSASADGSLTTSGTSKVVSLGKGTVRLADESQTA